MAKKSPVDELAAAMKLAVDDHVADVEDAKGFSKLDAVLASVSNGHVAHEIVEAAVSRVLPKVIPAGELAWEALRMIVESAKLKSAPIATVVMRMLESRGEITDSMSRFQAFLLVRALGRPLVRRQLDDETGLYKEHRALWIDLVVSSLKGMPDHIVTVLEEEVSKGAPEFSGRDVLRRLPHLFHLLGEDFNRAIVRIAHAIPSVPEREKLAAFVKKTFQVDPLAEQAPDGSDAQERPSSIRQKPRLVRATSRPDRFQGGRLLRDAFSGVLAAGISNLKSQKNMQAAYGAHQ